MLARPLYVFDPSVAQPSWTVTYVLCSTGFGFRAHIIETSQTIRPSVLNRFGLRADIVEKSQRPQRLRVLRCPFVLDKLRPSVLDEVFQTIEASRVFGSSLVSLRVGD